MADPFAAALVVASLCMPPSSRETTVYIYQFNTEMLGQKSVVAFGIKMPLGPPHWGVKIQYEFRPGERESFESQGSEADLLPKVTRMLAPRECRSVG